MWRAVIGGIIVRGALIEMPSLRVGALVSEENFVSMSYRHYVGMTRHAATMNQ